MKPPYTVIHLTTGEALYSPVEHSFTDMQVEDWKENIVKALGTNGPVTMDTPNGHRIVRAQTITHIDLVLKEAFDLDDPFPTPHSGTLTTPTVRR